MTWKKLSNQPEPPLAVFSLDLNNIKEISARISLPSRYNMSYFKINTHKHKLLLYMYT